MKRALYVIAAVVAVSVCALIGIAIYVVTTAEDDKNKKKTEPARQARWAKETAAVEEATIPAPSDLIKTENV